jgi:hypothetical protein
VWSSHGWDITITTGSSGVHGVEDGHPVALVGGSGPLGAVSLLFSHEVEEMLVDPYVSRYWPDGELVEVADPVQRIEVFQSELPVEDFVLPGWYAGAGPWDAAGLLTGPGQWIE